MQTSRFLLSLAAAAATGGCTLLDDDEPTVGGTDGATELCLAGAEELHRCEYPYQWWVSSDGGSGKLVLVDDPAAKLSVGPNAWLFALSSSADYVGTHNYAEGACYAHCGWCDKGEVPCQAAIPGELPHCNMCLPYDPDVGALVDACAEFVEACLGADGEGLGETGADTEAMGEYDCGAWRPGEGVRYDGNTVIVDAALVEEALLYQAEPLASCDDTRFRQRSDGYFELSRLSDHGLLAAMGLERGDVILAVDGAPLNDLDTVMAAAGRISTAASFTITVSRAGEKLVSRVVVR